MIALETSACLICSAFRAFHVSTPTSKASAAKPTYGINLRSFGARNAKPDAIFGNTFWSPLTTMLLDLESIILVFIPPAPLKSSFIDDAANAAVPTCDNMFPASPPIMPPAIEAAIEAPIIFAERPPNLPGLPEDGFAACLCCARATRSAFCAAAWSLRACL